MKFIPMILMVALVASPARASQDCIDLDVTINRFNSMMQPVGQTRPADTVFDYGDHFHLMIDGARPGTYFLENISPEGDRKRISTAAYSDGFDPIILPCGLPGMCRGDEGWLRFDNDQPKLTTGSVLEEMLIVYYLPCLTDDPARDRDIAHLAERLPFCHGQPELFPADHRFATMRAESISLVEPVTSVCDLPPVGEPILLYERVALKARR